MSRVNTNTLDELYPGRADFVCSLGTACFEINISDSTFTNIPYEMNMLTDANISNSMVNNKNGIRF